MMLSGIDQVLKWNLRCSACSVPLARVGVQLYQVGQGIPAVVVV
jgi:hypothetical protein